MIVWYNSYTRQKKVGKQNGVYGRNIDAFRHVIFTNFIHSIFYNGFTGIYLAYEV